MLSDVHYVALGRVARYAARVEFSQASLAAALVSPDPAINVVIAPNSMPFSRSSQFARQLIAARFGIEPAASTAARAALNWLADAREAMNERDKCMHGLWGMNQTGQIGFMNVRDAARSRDVTPDELHVLADRLDGLGTSSIELVIKLSHEVILRTSDILALLATSEQHDAS